MASETTKDLLFEIGCEELPASFVAEALTALPRLAQQQFEELRLGFGSIEALGTPRRLSLFVRGLAAEQADLEQQLTGPPVKVAFRDGQPTKAAEAFANKVGCTVEQLEKKQTPKGEYLTGTKKEAGRAAADLLPSALQALVTAIPFRKSMRWGSGSLAFGRPVRWLLALLDEQPLQLEFGEVRSSNVSYGHRFLHPDAIEITSPQSYVDALRNAHVLVDPAERDQQMRQRLARAAAEAGGELIEDDFLFAENLSLAEEPQVILGSFDDEFLELPECVVLEVARGHQRYFCLRSSSGKLLPKYLAVVNTAEHPEIIRLGNDRVMRARLADAKFFYHEDLERPMGDRRAELAGIVFQNRLGSVLAKVERIEQLTDRLGQLLDSSATIRELAVRGAGLAKCDLVSLMVGAG